MIFRLIHFNGYSGNNKSKQLRKIRVQCDGTHLWSDGACISDTGWLHCQCTQYSNVSYLHRSSGAYETLRESGCLRLPSQRTLRDYTHYVKAAAGFSHEVDMMLFKAVKMEHCPEREKLVLLLLDEMHIREDIVYDKHSGEMIGFANLGEINEHLSIISMVQPSGPVGPVFTGPLFSEHALHARASRSNAFSGKRGSATRRVMIAPRRGR